MLPSKISFALGLILMAMTMQSFTTAVDLCDLKPKGPEGSRPPLPSGAPAPPSGSRPPLPSGAPAPPSGSRPPLPSGAPAAPSGAPEPGQRGPGQGQGHGQGQGQGQGQGNRPDAPAGPRDDPRDGPRGGPRGGPQGGPASAIQATLLADGKYNITLSCSACKNGTFIGFSVDPRNGTLSTTESSAAVSKPCNATSDILTNSTSSPLTSVTFFWSGSLPAFFRTAFIDTDSKLVMGRPFALTDGKERPDGPAGRNGTRPERPDGPAGRNGTRPERPDGPAGRNGTRPDRPEGPAGRNGTRPEKPEGPAGRNGTRPEKPEGPAGRNGTQPGNGNGHGHGPRDPKTDAPVTVNGTKETASLSATSSASVSTEMMIPSILSIVLGVFAAMF